MSTHIPACARNNNTDHLGALLAHQNNLSSRISQQLMNIRWERIIPRKRRPPPAKAGEAVRSAVKRCPLRINLLKDSLALVSRILYNCGWISSKWGWEEACPCVRMCESTFVPLHSREWERGMTERHLSPSISINLQLDFYSSCLFIMNWGWIVFQSPGCEGRISGLKFFKLCVRMARRKRQAECQRFLHVQ